MQGFRISSAARLGSRACASGAAGPATAGLARQHAAATLLVLAGCSLTQLCTAAVDHGPQPPDAACTMQLCHNTCNVIATTRAFAFLARTLPADSIANPACMKNTCGVQARKQPYT